MSAPTIRTWVHHDAVVLGIQDHRLPYIQEGMTYLASQGFEPIVRNSGGLAVVLDAGVLNISLVLSEQDKKISINEGFEMMVDLIKRLLPEVADKIEVYEIVGSYCPGTFDLSIGGQKFAGISQRRMKNGIAVQIYLCVEGSEGEGDYGYNARTGVYEDLRKAGIVDPAKVTRSALQNASSIASMLLTTEAAIVEISEEKPAMPDMVSKSASI